MSVNEFMGASEQVLTVLRKGGEMPRPDDTRCRAAVGSGRCKNEIVYDTQGDNWSRWCEKHLTQEEKARTEGGERVHAFSGLFEDVEEDAEE